MTQHSLPCALCREKNLEFEHHAVCRAGFFGGCSEHVRAKNFLSCTCRRSMLGKCTTVVHELRKFRDNATVDQIFIEGDRMYFNALQNQSIPDTETMSLIYLPNQARLELLISHSQSRTLHYNTFTARATTHRSPQRTFPPASTNDCHHYHRTRHHLTKPPLHNKKHSTKADTVTL